MTPVEKEIHRAAVKNKKERLSGFTTRSVLDVVVTSLGERRTTI
jgi:hypothetical protein